MAIQPKVDPNLMLDRLVRLIVMPGLTTQEAAFVRELQRRRQQNQVIDVTRAELEQIRTIHNKIYTRTRR